MKVTVDANIIFAAIIKKGDTRKIWFNAELELFAPRFIFIEFQKYKQYLQKKSALKEDEFNFLANKLISNILFVDDKKLKAFMPAAASLSSDEKDWLYLACALKEDTIIWSEDKHMKKQSRIKVMTTAEMLDEFGGL